MTLSEMVQELINRHGLTEGRIAKLVGVQQPTINRIKRGTVVNASYTTGKAIERLYYSMITRS